MIYKTTKEILESLSPFISENDVSVSNEEHEKEDGSGKEIRQLHDTAHDALSDHGGE